MSKVMVQGVEIELAIASKWLIETKHQLMVWSQSIIQNRKITLGHDESGNSSGGDCRDDSVALLGNADLAMPPPVGLGGGEHVASAAHVTESTLARAVSSTSANARNTCDSTAGSPRFGAGLMT